MPDHRRVHVCVDPTADLAEPAISAWLSELGRVLASPPTCIGVGFGPLPRDVTFASLVEEASKYLGNRFGLVGEMVKRHLGEQARLIVVCGSEHPLAVDAQTANHMARWGAAHEHFALVWRCSDQYAMWHEVLHLLGADDCYDGAGHTTCGLATCLMQWAPSSQSVGKGPLLCPKNIDLVRAAVAGRRS